MSLIYTKMAAVMKDIGSIGKNQKNASQGYRFRGVDDLLNNLYPILVRHEIFMLPQACSESHELKDVTRSNGKLGVDKHVYIQMKYIFCASDGSNVVVGPIPAEGLDSGDKATNKALSAALKYALIQTFSIPTEDMEEADRTSPEAGSSRKEASLATPETAAAQAGTLPLVALTAEPVKKARSTFRKNTAVAETATNGSGNEGLGF